MKRICVVVQSYYLRDPRVRREAEALVEAGYEVDVLTLKDKNEPWKETVNGVKIHRLPLMRKRGSKFRYIFEYGAFLVIAGIAQMLLHPRRRYSLVHINNMPDILVFSALFPKFLGAKVLLDVHDPMAEMFISKYGLSEKSLPIRFLWAQERLSHKIAHFSLTVSEVMGDRLVKLGVPKERVGIVLNLPDGKVFRKVRTEEDAARSKDTFTILFTGTVAERYGLDLAMKSVVELQEKCPGLRLRVVGEGDHMPVLRKLRKTLGADCVDFEPPVPITRIPEIAAECDAAIQPHLQDCYMDLYFSTKIIESMAMGLPVISSATETLKRYFDDSEVVFVEPGNQEALTDAIQRMYENAELRRTLVSAGAGVLDRLNWDREKRKFIEIIDNVLAGKAAKQEARNG